MIKYIIGTIIGVCLTITILSVLAMLNMRGRISQLEGFAVQVTQLINSQKQTK